MDDVVEPAADEMLLPRVLAALADPARLATVRFLARHGESWCAQVRQEAGLELSKSTFSHHLRILREAGLVEPRAEGQRRIYELRPAGLAELIGWVAPYQRLWQGSLDALERHLDSESERTEDH